MKLHPGTPVIRLFPGSIQIGCDPGEEVIFSGLSIEQEDWLLTLAAHAQPRPLSRLAPQEDISVPDGCETIAQTLKGSGYCVTSNDSGLRLNVHQMEEPLFLALMSAIDAGVVSTVRIHDKRLADSASFHGWWNRLTGESIAVCSRRILEQNYPDLRLPDGSGVDLEMMAISLFDELASVHQFMHVDIPRFYVHCGQRCAVLGPLVSPDSSICPYCVAHWIADLRRGSAQLAVKEHTTLPSMPMRLVLSSALIVEDFLKEYYGFLRNPLASKPSLSWCDRMVRVSADGRSEVIPVSAHRACGCSAEKGTPFPPLSTIPASMRSRTWHFPKEETV